VAAAEARGHPVCDKVFQEVLMNQNRKDQSMPNRQSNMEKAEGSRESVLGNKESFEHGSGTSEMARGMGSSGSRGTPSDTGGRHSKGGISNRGSEQERQSQGRVPERGRAQSEE
jgi:hypothetical protein